MQNIFESTHEVSYTLILHYIFLKGYFTSWIAFSRYTWWYICTFVWGEGGNQNALIKRITPGKHKRSVSNLIHYILNL